MRTRFALLAAVLSVAAAAALGAAPRVAVSDFEVSSENTRLKFVGKGLAEMIAVELASSEDILLIDRDRRTELLSEQEFSLSDAADAESQVQIGRLLAADYILYGEIVDMDRQVLVTAKMLNVESGQVVWSDKHLGALSDYDLISSGFVRAALEHLGSAKAPTVALTASTVPEAKKEEVLLAFSQAVDSYDRNDKTEARKQLETARRIDPKNRAVALYLRKVAEGNPRFQIELDKYAPSYNPARVGLAERGSVYYWASENLPWEMMHPTYYPVGDLEYMEMGATQRLGTLLPLGRRWGLATEVSWSVVESATCSSSGFTDVASNVALPCLGLYSHAFGANAGAGYRIAEGLSLGLGARIAVIGPWRWLWYGEELSSDALIILDEAGVCYALDGGLSYQSPGGRLGADLQVVWSNQPDPYLDDVADPAERTLNAGVVPLILAGSVTGSFLDHSLFAAFKLIGDVYTDARSGLALRVIPAVEWWPLEWLAVRLGYEYSFLSVSEIFADGHGFAAGLSLLLGRWELHFNYVNRYRPYRLLLGEGQRDQTLLIGTAWNGLPARR